ncbi:MAG: hypothetical protein U1F61_13890 [Opitutaceae bacterium]|jgi:hypothetical protein
MPSASVNRWWLWAALALTAFKLWLTSGQTIYAIGPAFHDDKLFATLAAHILRGDWLGPYDQFTLAKGPMYPLFLAGVFWLGLPLLLTQQVVYAAACAVVTRSLKPWFRSGGLQFSLYALLLWNPISYDAGNLSRLMRQNIYTPLALLVVAGLVQLFARRRESWGRQAGPALLAGFALGGFWLTREESVWLLPAVGLLLVGIAASLRGELAARWRTLSTSLGLFLLAFVLPLLTVCALNQRHYHWFGTVEFRATEFKDAYGALMRIKVGPDLPQVPITRQMREAAYEISPAFARLRPQLEGPVGEHWFERQLFAGEDRQIRGGWFVWAIRDAMVAAGLAPDAGQALENYRKIAEEINAACDAGRVPSRPRRSGFMPPLGREYVTPLFDGAVEYAGYFVFFKGFTAYSPDSVGDYADLRPFRDIVGTRLSHAPRSPDPFPANQAEWEHAKVDRLETIGRATGEVLGWLGPLLLLIGLIRLGEAGLERKVTYLLGLATALLGACAAYLAINVLVSVTSFNNMSPAAMATAYPLYLLALAVIAADAVRVWSRPAMQAVRPPAVATASRWLALLPAGTAIIVLAARLREIHLFAGDVPYNDQWIIEAQQIIAPWLEGTLRPWHFFTPHFEHLPVWTRLLVWLQVAVTGRWDPLVQMTINSGLYAGFVWLVARWLWETLTPRPAAFVTALLVCGGALPHAWENIAWGFQSQFPLALLCLFAYVRGTCTQPLHSRGWWLAQLAGLAGLFTLASMWLAPLAMVLSVFWTRRQESRGALRVPLVITGLGIGLLLLIHLLSPGGHSFAQASRSPLDFLHSALHLLSWPSGLPGALAVLQLPWLIHALRLRRQNTVAPLDRMVFVFGLWVIMQALGLAFARTGDNSDYVSRYGDLLFIGTLAGALALTRLVPATTRARAWFFGGALVWSGIVLTGLFVRATEGHARYFHQNAAQANQLRLAAVQAYLRDGDKHLLEQTETRWVLTQSTDVLTGLLDQTDFRALLPATVNPANPTTHIGNFNRAIQARWLWLLLGGGGIVLAGVVVLVRRGSPAAALPGLSADDDPWPARLALLTALASGIGLLLWSNPLVFDKDTRWHQMLGGKQALTGLTFHFATPSTFGPERLQGAAPLSPVELRNQFFGTAPAGPGFTGTVLSSNFVLSKPWLIVPYGGYPVSDGNGLRVQLLDDSGTNLVGEIGCPGPNLNGIGYWAVDTKAYLGRPARLVLYDGRSETEGWVAAAPPIPADNAELATTLEQRLQNENHAGLHASLAALALAGLAGWFVAWRAGRPQIAGQNR